jgi:hypothetical protein
MLPRHRRIGHDVARPIDDTPIEPLLTAVDASEHKGCRQALEGAADREALVGAMPDLPAYPRVANDHAEPAAVACFQFGEPIFHIGCICRTARRRSRGEEAGNRCQRGPAGDCRHVRYPR